MPRGYIVVQNTITSILPLDHNKNQGSCLQPRQACIMRLSCQVDSRQIVLLQQSTLSLLPFQPTQCRLRLNNFYVFYLKNWVTHFEMTASNTFEIFANTHTYITYFQKKFLTSIFPYTHHPKMQDTYRNKRNQHNHSHSFFILPRGNLPIQKSPCHPYSSASAARLGTSFQIRDH